MVKRKNYIKKLHKEALKDKNKNNDTKNNKEKVSFREFMEELGEFLNRDKTKFDLKDRTKAVLFLVSIIILLEIVLNYIK
jgi:hypothetical protein